MHAASPRARPEPSAAPTGLGALLEACGVPLQATAPAGGLHPDLAWARSGAMALCGEAGAAPLLAPAPLAARADALVRALARLAPTGALAELDGAALLGERAALFGLTRGGPVAPGGSCRLLRAADGWLAVNLARPDDRELLPAWLGEGDAGEPWSFVAARAREQSVADLVERGRLLSLPVAPATAPPRLASPWLRVEALGTPRRLARPPLVVDLTALWAGPLCAQLLRLAGAHVVKVESAARPDGARFGPPRFFDLLNAGAASLALDFSSARDRERLLRLVERADIVLEGSRPRALRQLGLDAEALVRSRPGLTWVGISGYGRREPGAGWVAFGDDAGVAAGLAVATGTQQAPLFCADAVADPLAGLHAALAALASQRCGGGHLLDVALRDGVAHLLAAAAPVREARVESAAGGWCVALGGVREPVQPPRARRRAGRARPLGADTPAVLAELGIRC